MMKARVMYLTLLLIMFSCARNEYDIDISNIDAEIRISRFEKDLFEIDPAELEEHIIKLENKYSRFFQIFNYKIINIGSTKDEDYAELLRLFVTDYVNFKLYERTMEIFPVLDELSDDIEESFKRYKYYFPANPVPEIFTYISGFNQSAISDENLLAIGLDKYLGRNEEFYKKVGGLYDYMLINMHKDKILSDIMRLWATTEFSFKDSVNNLINNMIYEGKIMYFVNTMLPYQPDTLKWGFTDLQMRFCRNNEKQMWAYIIENKLIFNTDKFRINQFIREGPFTKDFSRESPARAAVWLGYNIVTAYMKKNKKLRLPDLMYENNYMKILNQSGYNP
ncbi:MAG: hypothetical protein JSV22_01120 [Bacteroidales bacterium]|nr:MAG: hypothetical protein JSV22_01120 [Bacteroidales bacterium]